MSRKIDFECAGEVMDDGSVTIVLTVSNIPTMAMANQIGEWFREAARAHAHEIGMHEGEVRQ